VGGCLHCGLVEYIKHSSSVIKSRDEIVVGLLKEEAYALSRRDGEEEESDKKTSCQRAEIQVSW